MYNLTEAEEKVFNLLKQGYTNQEIGEQLGIATISVKSLAIRVYKKTGIKGRMELLTNVIRQMNEKKEKVDNFLNL